MHPDLINSMQNEQNKKDRAEIVSYLKAILLKLENMEENNVTKKAGSTPKEK